VVTQPMVSRLFKKRAKKDPGGKKDPNYSRKKLNTTWKKQKSTNSARKVFAGCRYKKIRNFKLTKKKPRRERNQKVATPKGGGGRERKAGLYRRWPWTGIRKTNCIKGEKGDLKGKRGDKILRR